MRLSKTAVWAIGVLIMLLILGINRGLFLMKAKYTTGESIGSQNYTGRRSGGRSFHVHFVYEGNNYYFWTSRFSSARSVMQIPVIFNPDDPEDAYENTFGGFWLWGLVYIAIAFVPWSAASLSFIGSDEQLVIGRKKFGLEKIPREDSGD